MSTRMIIYIRKMVYPDKCVWLMLDIISISYNTDYNKSSDVTLASIQFNTFMHFTAKLRVWQVLWIQFFQYWIFLAATICKLGVFVCQFEIYDRAWCSYLDFLIREELPIPGSRQRTTAHIEVRKYVKHGPWIIEDVTLILSINT